MMILRSVLGLLGRHLYLSTSCLHGRHEHCSCLTGIDGDPKVPGRCKWCPSKCICRCHKVRKAAARR